MNEYIVVFIIYSFLGWVWESILCTVRDRKWANRGVLYGPICPIYGFGCIICLATYDMISAGILPDLPWYIIFALGFGISMLLEYPTSWVLEKLFHARWWDYSKVPLNLHGRTSVPTSIGFGIAAIVIMKLMMPFTNEVLDVSSDVLLNIISIIFIATLSSDITLTISALTEFQKHVSEIDYAFQNHMTNAVYNIMNRQGSIKQRAINRISMFKLPVKKAETAKKLREKRFDQLIREYLESPEVRKMNEFMHHGNTSTLEHCKSVAWISFLVNDRLHLNADEKELVSAAILHDFFLYDWHESKELRKTHGFDHPYVACENAKEEFELSDKVQSAIKSHMWPLNITEIPKSKEAILLCFVDKYCAIIETLRIRNKKKR